MQRNEIIKKNGRIKVFDSFCDAYKKKVWHRTDTYKNIPYQIYLDQSSFVDTVAS